MTTRCIIVPRPEPGASKAVYVKCDGYPAGMLPVLAGLARELGTSALADRLLAHPAWSDIDPRCGTDADPLPEKRGVIASDPGLGDFYDDPGAAFIEVEVDLDAPRLSGRGLEDLEWAYVLDGERIHVFKVLVIRGTAVYAGTGSVGAEAADLRALGDRLEDRDDYNDLASAQAADRPEAERTELEALRRAAKKHFAGNYDVRRFHEELYVITARQYGEDYPLATIRLEGHPSVDIAWAQVRPTDYLPRGVSADGIDRLALAEGRLDYRSDAPGLVDPEPGAWCASVAAWAEELVGASEDISLETIDAALNRNSRRP